MCYTYQTSINSFCIGAISSLFLICLPNVSKQYKVLGWFFLYIILMQLYDAIFWVNLPPSNINKIATKFAAITNHLQPVIFCLVIYFLLGNVKKLGLYITLLYSALIIPYTINGWKTLEYTEVTSKSSPSLDWKWNHFDYSPVVYSLYVLSLLVLGYQNLSKPINIIFCIFTSITFLFSYYKYQIKGATGRFWCYFAAFVPAFFVLYSYLVK